MFFDSDAWPPPPGGEPVPERRAISPREERWLTALAALVLIALFVGPFAGSSVIAAAIALLGAR